MLARLLLSDYFVLVVTAAFVLVMTPIVPELATLGTARDAVLELIPLLIVVIGLVFVLVVGAIDLSITSIIAMASVVGASIMTGNGGYLSGSTLAVCAAIAAFLAVGGAIGWLNGLATTRLGMPSFMVTLAAFMFFAGAAVWFTSAHTASSSIANLPSGFTWIGRGTLFGIPIALLIAGVVVMVAWLILNRTVLGRWMYAVGQNAAVARTSGVPVAFTIRMAFLLSGICAALASIIMTARLETGSPVLGQRMLLDVIGAAVIGGVSLYGGAGTIVGALFGVVFLTVVDIGLRLLGLSLFAVYAIKGAVILAAAAADGLRHRMKAL